MAKIGKTPHDLRQPITVVAQRQNRMTESLRDRVSVTGSIRRAFTVRLNDTLIRLGMVLFHPRQQRRAKVETDLCVIIDDVFADDGGSVVCVAFSVNAFVPVVIRRGANFLPDLTSPWVFARRLIEMAVED
jgi:hypothetical protein